MSRAVRPFTLAADAVLLDGRLQAPGTLSVDAQGFVSAAPAPDAERLELPGCVVLPGLVNAHSHAFQRVLRGRTEYLAAGHERDDFWSWREAMYAAATALSPEALYAVSRQTFVEMALAGITTVGEFHYLHHQPDGTPYDDGPLLARVVVQAARDAGLRVALLRVGYARAGFQVPDNPRQRRFIDPSVDAFLARAEDTRRALAGDPLVTVGLAPHSVRAVPKAWLEAVARARPPVVHMHVAEQPLELKACLAEHGRTPVDFLADLGLLSPAFTGVHGVHLSDGEVQRFGAAGATVCACPSTERNLGDGVVPADALLAAGATVALGSDSQAHVDLLEEARQLEGHLRLVRLKRNVLDPARGAPDGLGARLLASARSLL